MFSSVRQFVAQGFYDLATRPVQNIASLDLLRTLAIVLVFSGHFAYEFRASPMVQRFPLVYFGWTGVDLFFVLSGYLIGYQIWKELRNTGNIKVGTFLLRRGFRIWPLYFTFVLLIAFEAFAFHRNRSGLWADATFLSNYFHHQVGGGWSLSTEEQFYILLPIFLVLASHFLPARRLVLLPLAALGAFPVMRYLTIRYSGMNLTQVRDWMYSPIHTHADGLAVGVLLAWIVAFKPDWLATSRFRILAACGMFAVGATLYAINRDIFNYSSLGLIFGAMLLLGLGLKRNILVQWRGFYVVSRLSYGIYLNHFGLLPKVVASLKKFPAAGGQMVLAAYAESFVACLGFAALTFVLVEAPFLRLRHRSVDKAPRPGEPPVGALPELQKAAAARAGAL